VHRRKGSLTRGSGPGHSSVLVYLVLYQAQVLLDYAALVWSDGESVDVSVGDREVVNDCICRERDGHVRLPSRVARINASRICFK
jgi:hypothetical protein